MVKNNCRVLIVSQVYHPSHDAISQLLVDLAVGLVETGLDVQVISSAVNYMTGEPLPLYEVHKGVKIWRTPAPRHKKANLFSRMFAYGVFLSLTGPFQAFVPKPDVVVYLSTPPFLSWNAKLLKLFNKSWTIFVAQDIYPEILEKSGHIRNHFLIKALSRIDRAVLAGMDRVVVLGKKMKEVMEQKGVSPSKISIIENWSIAPEMGRVDRKSNPFLIRMGLNDKFVVQYSGNMGVVHDMSPIIEAATILKNDASTVFLFIGGGKRRAEVERKRDSYRLNNVVLLPYQPIEELGVSLASADVALISLRPEMEGLVFPSKLYGILAAGRPVINIGHADGEIARIIKEARCGFTVQTGIQLVAAIDKIKSNETVRESMGNRAREYFDSRYGRARSIAKYRSIIDELNAR